MLILGIESSCDETGLALYELDNGLLAHALHSQVALHALYGGVVPELASRDHIRRVVPLLRDVLQKSGRQLSDIDAVAYTQGPGLAGALLVGVSFAQGLAFSLGVPVVPVHHLEGHLLSPLLSEPTLTMPFVALLVSGGHTQLMAVSGYGQYEILGESLDDAVGEAFDKTAKLLGLPYPGGAALSKLAELGRPGVYNFPRPLMNAKNLDFSFSGLKTAVLLQVKACPDLTEQAKADIACAFQEAIVDVLVKKSLRALTVTGLKKLVVAGGVGANAALRARLHSAAERSKFGVFFPSLEFCTDNGAMIAQAGALRLKYAGGEAPGAFAVRPRWPLEEFVVSGQ